MAYLRRRWPGARRITAGWPAGRPNFGSKFRKINELGEGPGTSEISWLGGWGRDLFFEGGLPLGWEGKNKKYRGLVVGWLGGWVGGSEMVGRVGIF